MPAAEQLRRQLRFIEASCCNYDVGSHDEAVRIAVALRVLLHDTCNSHSVLSQLGLRQSIQLLSTFPPHTSTMEGIAMSFNGFLLSSAGLEPALDRVTYRGFLTVDDWWRQVVHIVNHEYSRRDIVLSAANQDGGAHVDPNPSEETTNLQLGIGTLTTTSAEGHITTRNLDNAHFWLLRQFGYEILHSPTLIDGGRPV